MNQDRRQPFPPQQPPQQQPRRIEKPPLQHVRKHPAKAHQPVGYTEKEQMLIQSKLNKALGPEYVSYRPAGGGSRVQYIEGWKALNLANEIFGFNGWSSEVISCEIDYFDTHGNSGRFSLGLSIIVRITLKDGTFHEDIGYGFIDNSKSKAAAFEKCKKEAYTDGIKRCLRCFGNVLGNCLYDKTITRQIDKLKEPPAEYEAKNFHRDPLLVERERKRVLMEQKIGEQEEEGKKEELRQRKQQDNTGLINETRETSLVAPHPNAFVTPKSPVKIVNISKKREAEEIDESFLFSDDFYEDDSQTSNQLHTEGTAQEKSREVEKNEKLPQAEKATVNTTTVATTASAATTSTTATTFSAATASTTATTNPTTGIPFPAFVTAKSATLVQQNQDQKNEEIKKFDTTFVSPHIRRTVDPTKSVPIKRTDTKNSPSMNHLPIKINNSNTTTTATTTTSTNVSPLNSIFGKRVGLPPSKANKRIHLDPIVHN
ncbi:RAD52 [Candida oxycetoniae]|uniref:DNA repair and recombination protein RAD52 n=1 Tax=Candida oxycetoniae TaxID=497107 RepID=A0AAI9T1V0_9ASCO|nr:RAD52 [Candida oxycetoniae]KAI3407107.2 RAD52 [Candida oxycetoniae]